MAIGTPAQTRFAAPDSYTPKHLAEKILTSKAALEGERKQVTVLFADLKGSMELLADRDPEEARKLLDPFPLGRMPGVSFLERLSLLRLLTTAICFAGRVRHQDSFFRDDEQRIPASGTRLAPHRVLVALSAALAAPQRRRFNCCAPAASGAARRPPAKAPRNVRRSISESTRPQDDNPAPGFGSPNRPAMGVGGPQISTRSVSCASASQMPPYWVWQAPCSRRLRTNTARSAKCPGGIFAAVARCSRQYVWMVLGG